VNTPAPKPRQLVGVGRPRVGIVGAARIVPKALLAAAPGLIDVCAVAARDPARARAFADLHGIPDSHGSYEEMLLRRDLDAVYIALPASHHSRWTLAALAAEKHVLCEKPFGLGAAEARACVASAVDHGRLLMEAHHWRYHPLVDAFCAAAREVGPITAVNAVFDAPIRAGNIRLDVGLGAGVLLDFGCYLVQWLALAADDDDPEVLEAHAEEDEPGVDVAFRAKLRSKSGADLTLSCDMRPHVPFVAFVEIVGKGGKVRFENPLNGQEARLVVQQSEQLPQITEALGPTTFRRQLEAFVAALHGGHDTLTSGAAIVQTQVTLDRLYRAAGLPSRLDLARGTRG
jgi:predicted dehydrogenase